MARGRPKKYHETEEERKMRLNIHSKESYYKNKEAYKQRAWKNHLLRSYQMTDEVVGS